MNRYLLIFLLFSSCFSKTIIGFDSPPNVVLFLIDDLGHMDLGCYGSTFHQTPNIDRLAASGVRFTDFYSANPVCSPTRAALMTGKAPQRVGITQWINQPSEVHLPLDEVTIGEAMANSGYQTGYIGKWHLGEKDDQQPSDQGFTWTRCVNRAGQPASYFFPFKRRNRENTKPSYPYWDVPDLKTAQEGDYLTDKLTDHAIEFIEQNQDRPFFLCFAHYAVHTPIQAPSHLVKKYKPISRTVKPIKASSERNGAVTRNTQNNPNYAAMVENLDTNVGRVLSKLSDLKLTSKTIVIFTSDNGGLSTLRNGQNREGPTSCRPLRAGKGWTYEGGIRIPTIVNWPGKIKPTKNSTPAITMDLYPTILDMAGLAARPEQHLDGLSLKRLLTNGTDRKLEERFLAWTYPHRHGSGHTPSNALRRGDWKLIHRIDGDSEDDNRFELYHLKDDPSERNNLADENQGKTNELSTLLSNWLVETNPK